MRAFFVSGRGERLGWCRRVGQTLFGRLHQGAGADREVVDFAVTLPHRHGDLPASVFGGNATCYHHVISCRLDRVKIGVAGDARKRLRELQVGSPVELKLAHIQPYPEHRDAVAVCEELYRSFAGRRVHGSWYRLTLAQVRERLSRRATLEAPARARAAEAAARKARSLPAGASGCERERRSSAPTSAAADTSERANRSWQRGCAAKG